MRIGIRGLKMVLYIVITTCFVGTYALGVFIGMKVAKMDCERGNNGRLQRTK